jgi:Bax protein
VEFGLPRDQHIPKAIIIAMAMMESDNGSSRFALEGNNLFGIRTWDPNQPQMKAYYQLNAKWGLKKYRTKCAAVQDMMNILNTKDVHKDFRYERNRQMSKKNPDVFKIVDKLDKWATNPNYREGIKQIIQDNLQSYLENP